MSKSRGKIPAKPIELIGYTRAIAERCRENQAPTKWNIPGAQLARLEESVTKAQTAFDTNNDKATKNHQTAAALRGAVKELHDALVEFINGLLANDKVPDTALAEMNIRPRHPGKHEPLPPPTDAPVVTLTAPARQTLHLYLAEAQAGAPHTYLSTPGHHGAKLRWHFTDGEEVHYEDLSKKQHILSFGPEAVGRTVQVDACWLNPRLQPGPWSDPQTKLIV
ncbi:MAG: hypothetical protein LBK71_11155, partial [Verrucomicrobiales bacterium]|jgi:hypothetical protein|nr:hypothetical protein [Verrucomicrobiales bacterium]